MQELEVAFNVRRELWSFVQLRAVLQEMDERWPVGQGPTGESWSEHRYIISRHGGDEDALSFVLSRQQPLAETEASATLQQLEELVQTHFATGTRLWHATQSFS
jgi:hypothetical protein